MRESITLYVIHCGEVGSCLCCIVDRYDTIMHVSNDDMRRRRQRQEKESKARDDGSKDTINYTWRDAFYRALPFKFADKGGVSRHTENKQRCLPCTLCKEVILSINMDHAVLQHALPLIFYTSHLEWGSARGSKATARWYTLS